MHYIKLKNLCIAKETPDEMKRQLAKWKKIYINDISGEGLIFKIYKEFTKLNFKKASNLIKNRQKT